MGRAVNLTDETGWRHWDSSQLLQSLLTEPTKKNLRPVLARPAQTVLELGAGSGDLAVAVAAAWRGKLLHYVATDLESNLEPIRDRIARADVKDVVTACALPWGEKPSASDLLPEGLARRDFDLVLLCEVLYWGGWDILQDDALELLSETLAAVLGKQTECICMFRERNPERETRFRGLCEERGFCVDTVAQELLAGHAPADPSDPDCFTEEPAGDYVAWKIVRGTALN